MSLRKSKTHFNATEGRERPRTTIQRKPVSTSRTKLDISTSRDFDHPNHLHLKSEVKPAWSRTKPIMRKREGKKTTSIFSTEVDVHEVMEDLAGIGIKLNPNQIERMQKSLNKQTNLEKLKSWAKNQQNELNDILHGISPQKKSRDDDLELSRTYSSTYSDHKGFMALDSNRASQIVTDMKSRVSSFKASSRSLMVKTIDALQVEYVRSPDTFVLKLLDLPLSSSKNKTKGFTKDILLSNDSNRFLEMGPFTTGIQKILPNVSKSDASLLFSLLSERMREIDETGRVWTMVVCVDVIGFLCVLGHAAMEVRRCFSNKASKTANDVEFWSDKRKPVYNKASEHPAPTQAHLSQPSNRRMSFIPKNKYGLIGGTGTGGSGTGASATFTPRNNNNRFSSYSSGALDGELRYWNEIEHEMSTRPSVSELLGSPNRKQVGLPGNYGNSFGALNRDTLSDQAQWAVSDAMYSPRKMNNKTGVIEKGYQNYTTSLQSPTKNPKNIIEKKEFDYSKPLDHFSSIAQQGIDGVIVKDVLHHPSSSSGTVGGDVGKRDVSFQQLQNEEYNSTTVAAALGQKREDLIGRGVAWSEKWEKKTNGNRNKNNIRNTNTTNIGNAVVHTSTDDLRLVTSNNDDVRPLNKLDEAFSSSYNNNNNNNNIENISSIGNHEFTKSTTTTRPSTAPSSSSSPTVSELRPKSYGKYDRDVKSTHKQYSIGESMNFGTGRGTVEAGKPGKQSLNFMSHEQYQHKDKHLLSNYNEIIHQSKKGVGVFQCMNYDR